jgi:hypothetical protein
VERPDHAALDERPKAFNGLSVDRADDILADMVVNCPEWIFGGETAISGPRIRAKQADHARDCFANESGQRGALDVADNPSDDISFAANRANHDGLAASRGESSARSAALVFVPILGFAADEVTTVPLGKPKDVP